MLIAHFKCPLAQFTEYFCELVDKLSIFESGLIYGPLLWMGFNCLKARDTSKMQFAFYH